MKKLKLISNIILAVQIYAAIFFPFWLVLSAALPPSIILNPFIISDTNYFKLLNIYGTYAAIPLTIAGVVLYLIWLLKNNFSLKPFIIGIIFIIMHIAAGCFNFILYCYNY